MPNSPSAAWMRALAQTTPIVRHSKRTFPLVIEESATRFGEAPALLCDEAVWSFRDLSERADRYARWALAQGLTPGTVLGLMIPNSPDYLAIWLGVTRVGGVVALLNTGLQGAALVHAIDIVAASHLIVAEGYLDTFREIAARLKVEPTLWVWGSTDIEERLEGRLPEWPERPWNAPEFAAPGLDDRALYIYTSGTSGFPKAVNISHFRIMQWAHWFAGLMDTSPADRMYNCLPMYHSIGGVVAVGAPLVNGGSVVLRPKFSASEFWPEISRWRCTLFQYIGELCRYLVNGKPQAAEKQHLLRLCCGNGLSADVWRRFKERFDIPHILEYYASTEGALSLFNCEENVGSIGRVPALLKHRQNVALIHSDEQSGEPIRDAAGRCRRCAVGEVGEAIVEIRSDAAVRFEGYTDPEASASKRLRDVFNAGDSWYRSGDLMRQDGAGFFYFVDRIGDTYRWKGENVATSEVAECLRGFEGIVDAAVFGVRIPGIEGSAGMAALQVEGPLDLTELTHYVKSRLPHYARPLFIRLLQQMPVTGTHKLKKAELLQAGFNPATTGDPIFFFDSVAGDYVAVNGELFDGIQGGQVRV